MKKLMLLAVLFSLVCGVAYALEGGDYVPTSRGDSSVTVNNGDGSSSTYVTSV